VRRRFARSRINLIQLYGPLADTWQIWDNRDEPPSLILGSESAILIQLEPIL
jgi:predicted ABC-type ATPase